MPDGEKPYQEELVETSAADGVVLTGVVIQPTRAEERPLTVVCIHGNGGNFYDYLYLAVGRELARHGYLFLSGNTRGHDFTVALWRRSSEEPLPGGSSWERLEDSAFDVAAWVEFAHRRRGCGVLLCGHGLGAAKVLFYQAEQADARVEGVVAVSPDVRGAWSSRLVDEAQSMRAHGQGHQMLYPFAAVPWYGMTADTVISRAEVLDRVYTPVADRPAAIAALKSPLLLVYGTIDIGGPSELERISSHAVAARSVDRRMVEGADHLYTARERQLASIIATWSGPLS